MLGNKIAFIGGSESGKTTLHAALRSKYGRLPDPPFPPDDKIARLLELKREHCASFVFTNRQGVEPLNGAAPKDAAEKAAFDEEAQKWANDLANAAEGLRQEPLRYPPRTQIPRRYWADVEFIIHRIRDKEKVDTYSRRLSLIDVPGANLDPGSPRYDARTVKALTDADAVVVFIDMTTALRANSHEARGLMESLTGIIKEAAKTPVYRDRFIPISILFTKADAAVPAQKLAEANNLFFRRYTLALSRASQNIQVMSCPISVEDPDSHLFRPKNIHLPFLFSTMGIIHSQALRAKAVADGIKTLSWWHQLKVGESAKSLLTQSVKYTILSSSIRDTLCSEYISGDKNIRFARDGEENFAHQIGFNL
jgi:signal recognition particle receptor subunit beta